MPSISLNTNIGGVPIEVRDLRREPNLQAALGLYLRELADTIDPPSKEPNHGQSPSQAQP